MFCQYCKLIFWQLFQYIIFAFLQSPCKLRLIYKTLRQMANLQILSILLKGVRILYLGLDPINHRLVHIRFSKSFKWQQWKVIKKYLYFILILHWKTWLPQLQCIFKMICVKILFCLISIQVSSSDSRQVFQFPGVVIKNKRLWLCYWFIYWLEGLETHPQFHSHSHSHMCM